jgi:uncharacterized protein YyaL (SSP411 family)
MAASAMRPSFPRPATHNFMHRYGATNGNEESGQTALQMSRHTLGAMSDGGMNDQLGGGFHRYSVDEQWIVSHFEKMLYDQAQLVISYIEMYQMTREPYFANTARNTLEYVLRDMTHPDGGFFSAEDADSLPSHTSTHKEEGAFYVWTVQELEEALGAENACHLRLLLRRAARRQCAGAGRSSRRVQRQEHSVSGARYYRSGAAFRQTGAGTGGHHCGSAHQAFRFA